VIGVDLPRYALRVSGLVALDKRVDFAHRFVPALVARVTQNIADGDLREWIDRELSSYGKDARGLTADAMRNFLAEQRAQQGGAPGAALDAIEQAYFAGN